MHFSPIASILLVGDINTGAFTLYDWLILAAFLLGTTWFGHAFRGRSKNIEGFFAGGRDLPWWAVSGSLIATTMSAMTFIAIPAIVFKAGGDLTFLQVVIGFVLGNFLLAHTLIKDLYNERYFSPYDFIEDRLGVKSAHLTRIFFLVGAVLSQSVRLLVTALILNAVTGRSLPECIFIIGCFAIVWTWMGGITTVIWTDVLQLVILAGGSILIILNLINSLPDGISQLISIADEKAKLRLLDFSLDPRKTYTLWVGLIGTTIFEFSQKSIDQVVTQRLYCCRSLRDAQKALYGAALGNIFAVGMLIVGLGLVAYFHIHPLSPELARAISEKPDRIVPYYIVNCLPVGVSGLLVATLFSAGITTLDSALSALSQTSTTDFYRRYIRKNESESHYLKASRGFVLFWGVTLCLLALTFESSMGEGLLNLGLKVPGYVYGSILGIALLAHWKIGSFSTVWVGSLLSVGSVLLLQSWEVAFFWWYPVAAIVMVVYTLAYEAIVPKSDKS